MSTIQVINEHIPQVIDQLLLERKAAEEKASSVNELLTLDLHSHKIFIIENLWQLRGLTVLRLNDNAIEKIENLDNLVQLVELNLSFNRISKIENLSKLVKIEKLLLHSNKITLLENLDALQNLQLLSLSKNSIAKIENIIYLRKLNSLKALTLDGNPLCDDPSYKDFIFVFLPNLRYYEYNLVPKDYTPTNTRYRQMLQKVEEEERELREKMEIANKNSERRKLLEMAFVSTIEPIILMKAFQDPNWKQISAIGGEFVSTLEKEYKKQVEKACSDLQEIGVQRLNDRNQEIFLFKECIEKASVDNKNQGLRKVDEFLLPKEDICKNLRKLLLIVESKKASEDSAEMDKVRCASDSFIDKCQILKDDLMTLEIELEEQIDEVLETFSENMENHVAAFKKSAKEKLLHLRDLELCFHQSLLEPCLVKAANIRTQSKLSAKEKQYLPKLTLELAKTPTRLTEMLIQSHDERLQAISKQEVKLNSECDAWFEALIKDFKEKEFCRGRARILEIATFATLQEEEMLDLQPTTSLPTLGLL